LAYDPSLKSSRRRRNAVESEPPDIDRSLPVRQDAELLAPGSFFTSVEVERLFEADSPLLAHDPYLLSAPLNTQKARRSDWRVFCAFCRERHFTALPATVAVLRAFLEACVEPSPSKSAATVERYLATIAYAHALTDHADPTKTAAIKGAHRHLIRGLPSSQPKAALRGAHIDYALEHLNTDDLGWDLRAKALLATAYCTMARRAELVALRVGDLTFNDKDADGVALVRNTKARREESRYLSRTAVTALKAWMAHARVDSGWVFRRFLNTGAAAGSALDAQEVARIIQRVGRLLNTAAPAGELPWPRERLGGHSIRIGAAHDLAAAGIDLTSIMHSGGWSDAKMPRYYTRELAAQESGMARLLKKRKGRRP
jgi:site-specific recombinase XerD